ncbi:unnamed protein product [Clavelina lepadiformis]|uniref:Tudor domain-containing protein 1 n=1 Tax=Clavelina lepadiformis TaxID=159417 RepID=A0ABP0F5Y0_CLALP
MDWLLCCFCSQKYLLPKDGTHIASDGGIPILLGCGHTFCRSCVVQLSEMRLKILCPTCKSYTICSDTGFEELVPNASILGMLMIGQKLTEECFKNSAKPLLLKKVDIDAFKQKCSECLNCVACTNCLQCGVSVCAKCFKRIHKNSRVLQMHVGVPIHQQSSTASTIKCESHQLPIELFCVDDNITLCRECVFDSGHEMHKVVLLQEKCREVAQEMSDATSKVKVITSLLKEELGTIEKELEDVKKESEQRRNEIIRWYLNLTGKIQNKFLSLIYGLELMTKAHAKHLFSLRDSATSLLNKIQIACVDAKMIMTNPVDVHSLDKSMRTLQWLTKATKHPCIMEITQINNEKTDFNFSNERFVLILSEDAELDLEDYTILHNKNAFKYKLSPASKSQLNKVEDGLRSICQLENLDEDSKPSKKCITEPKPAQVAEEKVEDKESEEADSAEVSSSDSETSMKLRLIQVPPARNQELVFVTIVTSPDDFYVQRNCDRNQASNIEKPLKAFNFRPPKEDELISYIHVDDLCAARYSLNNKWYRARVVKVLGSSREHDDELDCGVADHKDYVEIKFIDYGNYAKAKVSCLRHLPTEFRRIPALAIPCSLVGVTASDIDVGWSKESVVAFTKMIENRPVLMTTLSRQGGRRFVDLHKPGPDEIDDDVPVSVRDALLFLNFAKFSSSKISSLEVQMPSFEIEKPRDYFQPTSIPTRSFESVMLCHFESIDNFYVHQLNSNAVYLDKMSKDIQKFVQTKCKSSLNPASPFAILKPRLGMPCLAKYNCTKTWYRAKIMEVFQSEKKVTVLYVDYGNQSIIDIGDAMKIPDEFMKLPYQAIPCMLSDIHPVDADATWTDEILDRFFELVGDKMLTMYIRHVTDGIYGVELFEIVDGEKNDNILSVNERLVHEGFAKGLTVHKVMSPVENKETAIFKNRDQRGGNDSLVHQPSNDKGISHLTLDYKSVSSTSPNPSEMSSSSQSEDTSLVTVVFAQSPASFYVQTKEQWNNSNVLARSLHKKFKNSAFKESSDNTWNAGDVCAIYSKTEKRWCRARIIEIQNEGRCNIQLIDFGVIEIVSIIALQKLPSEFQNMPEYTTSCFLCDVQPAGGSKWTLTAQEMFADIVRKRECKLLNQASNCDEVGALPVKLFIPCSAQEDVDVSRELILRGVALPLFNLNSLKATMLDSDPTSKVQLLFQKSEAAYQKQENLHLTSSKSGWSSSQASCSELKNSVEDYPNLGYVRNTTPVDVDDDVFCSGAMCDSEAY